MVRSIGVGCKHTKHTKHTNRLSTLTDTTDNTNNTNDTWNTNRTDHINNTNTTDKTDIPDKTELNNRWCDSFGFLVDQHQRTNISLTLFVTSVCRSESLQLKHRQHSIGLDLDLDFDPFQSRDSVGSRDYLGDPLRQTTIRLALRVGVLIPGTTLVIHSGKQPYDWLCLAISTLFILAQANPTSSKRCKQTLDEDTLIIFSMFSSRVSRLVPGTTLGIHSGKQPYDWLGLSISIP
ncbi:hypothetical protein PGT21_035969 [Puccinia graminis f. sp. tritici]|uniref:Uncharacterized protein n=1 Tax=Puccinia graminis f. sp. tritici TaxID=56615 RepID=A0A5B0N8H9_PUCGR|nr:hypothetical protein PGT21_027168 [Puccinia graminis f. sp. tritici]KAA1084843.1 hypothetical protein PGT21_035969 [Puccinia graminis f. sp. tritici]